MADYAFHSEAKRLFTTMALILAFSVIGFSGMVLKRQFFSPHASYCGYLSAWVSTDGKTPALSVTLPSDMPTKYYVHVTSASPAAGCETNFDISYQRCDNGTCGAWSNPAPWGTYRSDSTGVARIDLDGAWPAGRTMNMKFRAQGSSLGLSNQVSVTFAKKPAPEAIDMSKYYIYKPGYLWEYKTTNHQTGATGISRLQVESETSICNANFYPWRYTKDQKDQYWNPTKAHNLRWFVANPVVSYAAIPSYNNYFWSFGDIDYTVSSSSSDPSTFSSVNGLRDINFDKVDNLHIYKSLSSVTPHLPSYNLSPKEGYPGYISYSTDSRYFQSWPTPVGNFGTTDCNLKISPVSGNSSWKLRIEKDTLPVWGDVVRTDQFEGGANMATDPLNRESWYFKEGVGLVKVANKLFNNYSYIAGTHPSCASDSDCWNDTMKNPDYEMDLIPGHSFKNPVLTTSVSKDGINYSNSVSVTQDQGYYLKVSPAYTGYLELNSNPPKKWLWAQDGVVKVPNAYAAGTYNSAFRIWIPNEKVPGETRIGANPIAFSNAVTINVTGSSACQNNTWYTSYNYSGYNWCQTDGNLCSSDWDSAPRVWTNCGTKRLQNTGSYCTRPDGTKSFVGNSSCAAN